MQMCLCTEGYCKEKLKKKHESFKHCICKFHIHKIATYFMNYYEFEKIEWQLLFPLELHYAKMGLMPNSASVASDQPIYLLSLVMSSCVHQ